MHRRLEPLFASAWADDPEPAAAMRRRRIVSAITLGVGSALLAATMAAPRGSAWFYTLAGLVAATWIAGALASGPLPLGPAAGPAALRRAITISIVVALAAFLVFLTADLVARHLPLVSGALHRVLATADAGWLPLVLMTAILNGCAEELFFRGALYGALGRHRPALYSTLAYVLVTVATRNLALVLAAAGMGSLWALQRRVSRGVLGPMITHTVWSSLMLLALPR